MQKVNKVLALVGGGSVATSFLCQFAESITKSSGYAIKLGISEVLIFEPKHKGGAGNAYQDDIDSNLLNTRAGTMSPMPSDPDHFLRWLGTTENEWREHYPTLEVTTNSFLPRALFGKYLEHVFSETITKLQILGFRVKRVLQELIAIDLILDSYKLTSSNGLKLDADYVVLAIGNHASTDLSSMEAHSEYFNTPYPCKKLTIEIDKNKSVCILGTSLSAIDAAVSLTDAGHVGKIIMVSRNGRLPSVRGEYNIKRLPVLLSRERIQKLVDSSGVLRLETVKNLLLEELLTAEGVIPNLPLIMRDSAGPQHYIDCEIEDASVRDRVWQAIVYGLNDSIDLIWNLLSDSDKKTFNQIYKSQWLAYRVSFPLQNALKIQKLLHTNQLTVFGGFESLRFDDALGMFGVKIHERKIEHHATLYSDYVVNATGYASDPSKTNSKLLNQLLKTGLAQINTYGGVDTDFETGLVVNKLGEKNKNLYALGSLSSGTYFWTNAMNVNARLAGALASRISDLPRIESDSPSNPNRPVFKKLKSFAANSNF